MTSQHLPGPKYSDDLRRESTAALGYYGHWTFALKAVTPWPLSPLLASTAHCLHGPQKQELLGKKRKGALCSKAVPLTLHYRDLPDASMHESQEPGAGVLFNKHL